MNTLAPIIAGRLYHKPIHEVWEIVTNQDYLSQWLMKGNFKAEVGHHYHFETEPKPSENCGGLITGEVLTVNKPFQIKFSWKAPELAESTMVTFILEETEAGTDFRIVHEGFVEENTSEIQSYTKGWNHHLSQIEALRTHEKES